MIKTFSSIKKLEDMRRQGLEKFNFNARLDINKIETFEKAYGIIFPESYKQFMANFNGGMMLEHNIHFYTDMTDWEPDGPKWSSYYFYTLDELEEKYSDLKYDSKIFGDKFKGIFPLIPICNTPKQETILLISQKGLVKESPVFISNDISNISTYVQIDDDFNSFLGKIIEHDGFPDLKTTPESQPLNIFISKNGIFETVSKEESYKEVIERTTALIKLNPRSAWSYNERGTAYRHNGQRKLALTDFNKSIELNPKESFFYYCRGAILLDYGSKRKALIDMDIAVKLDPDSLLFLTGRANTFQKLGKLDKALDDCNDVLMQDGIYMLALYVRERVYMEMGEDKLAQADSDLINDLNR